MKKRTKGIAAIITTLIIATTLTACGFHYKTPEEKADYFVEKVTKKLDLSSNQVIELEQLKEALLSKRQDFVERKAETRATIDELLSQSTLDQQRLAALVKEHTDAINEAAPDIIASLAGFYDSLTPEQQAKLHEKIKEHRDDHHHHY